MTRETKFNLIFLCIFLAISIPGGIILFLKKLDPNASRMSMPDPVRRRLPYMMPANRPGEDEARYVPEQAGQWLDDLTIKEVGSPMLLWNHRPVISSDRMFQVTAITPGAQTQMSLIVWTTDADTTPSRFLLECAQGEKTIHAEITAAKEVDIPQNVRKELVGSGYNKPPGHVVWLNARFAQEITPQAPAKLRMTYTNPATTRWQSELELFVHGSPESGAAK